MTKILFFSLFTTLLFFSSCNNSDKTTVKNKNTETTVVNYPYTIDKPDNWETGSTENTKLALTALKAWETGKMDEAVSYFGDSIQVRFDGMDQKMSNDQLKAFFGQIWNSTFKIYMKDWKSVQSKDKSKAYVTVFYRESWKDEKGVTDSIDAVNDFVIKNGKIVQLDNYFRKIH